MATAICYEKDGTEAGTFDLPAALFEGEVNESLLHQAVVSYLANQRQGTVNTKERADVRGGGRKPYRQKGTGRARAGTIRSPIYRGGGTVHGPHPRDYRQKMNKKMRRAALKSALVSRTNDSGIVVIKELEFAEPKTKFFAGILKNMDANGKTLVVLEKSDVNTVKSARNVSSVRVTTANDVNPYELVWADKIVFTSGAVKKMEEVFAS
jgi:large subunit ribosomal protein L4